MANFNKVMLMGNLTRDPEVRYTPSGMAVADLRLAVNRRYRTPDGQDREETCFVNVTVWARQAETCGQYLQKGRSVFVEGRLKFDEWEKDGQKLNRLSVVAERVQFLGDGGSRGGGQAVKDGQMPGEERQAVRAEAPPRDVKRESAEPGDEAAFADDATGDADLEDDVDNLPF